MNNSDNLISSANKDLQDYNYDEMSKYVQNFDEVIDNLEGYFRTINKGMNNLEYRVSDYLEKTFKTKELYSLINKARTSLNEYRNFVHVQNEKTNDANLRVEREATEAGEGKAQMSEIQLHEIKDAVEEKVEKQVKTWKQEEKNIQPSQEQNTKKTQLVQVEENGNNAKVTISNVETGAAKKIDVSNEINLVEDAIKDSELAEKGPAVKKTLRVKKAEVVEKEADPKATKVERSGEKPTATNYSTTYGSTTTLSSSMDGIVKFSDSWNVFDGDLGTMKSSRSSLNHFDSGRSGNVANLETSGTGASGNTNANSGKPSILSSAATNLRPTLSNNTGVQNGMNIPQSSPRGETTSTAGMLAGGGLMLGGIAGGGLLLTKKMGYYVFGPKDWNDETPTMKNVIIRKMASVGFRKEDVEQFQRATFKIKKQEIDDHIKLIKTAMRNNKNIEEQFMKMYNFSIFDGKDIDPYYLFIVMILDGGDSIDGTNMYNIINQSLRNEDEANFIYTGIQMDDYIYEEEDNEEEE